MSRTFLVNMGDGNMEHRWEMKDGKCKMEEVNWGWGNERSWTYRRRKASATRKESVDRRWSL